MFKFKLKFNELFTSSFSGIFCKLLDEEITFDTESTGSNSSVFTRSGNFIFLKRKLFSFFLS